MWLFLLLILPTFSLADIVVVYNSQTNEVLSLSSKHDAVIPDGYEEKVIPGDVEEYYAAAQSTDYKLNGNRLRLDANKVNKREEKIQKRQNKKNEMDMIKKQAYKDAYEKLKANGAVFVAVEAKDFE